MKLAGNAFLESALAREIRGIKINTIDAGGKNILDIEGNVTGKTEPLIEMYYSINQRMLISVGIRNTMKEYFIDT